MTIACITTQSCVQTKGVIVLNSEENRTSVQTLKGDPMIKCDDCIHAKLRRCDKWLKGEPLRNCVEFMSQEEYETATDNPTRKTPQTTGS